MLSKNNKILIGCLALLLVMSVGYALFSDTITINGTATAKGDFELATTCDEVESATYVNLGSTSDVKISCDEDIVNVSATLDYPGSTKWFRVMVTNTGTISAKLKKVVELNDPENNIVSKEESSYVIYNGVSNDDKTNYLSAYLYPDYGWTSDYETNEDTLNELWDDEIFDAVLDPGETAYFYIIMRWDSNSTTSGDPLTLSLNAQITWEQVTE